jgi:hypothetical protein
MKVPIIFLILLFFIIRNPHLTRGFTIEETLFVKSATAIAKSGYPIIYLDEQDPLVIDL